jgi:hypothetical protein
MRKGMDGLAMLAQQVLAEDRSAALCSLFVVNAGG